MHKRQTGLTLPEVLISLLITSILTLFSINAWSSKLTTTRLDGRVQELIQDLHWLRSQAVATKARIRLSVNQVGGASCYVIHTGQAHDCACTASGQAICSSGAQALKTGWFAQDDALQLSSNSSSMVWDPVHGTTTPTGTLSIQSNTGQHIKLVVNILGRVRTCSAQGHTPGHPKCAS
jgi:type IV fimbrial biogenesis protein FimT